LSKLVLKSLENVKPGRLIAIDWWDASVGKGSSSDMAIDVLIKSASGIFVGSIGGRAKHASGITDFRVLAFSWTSASTKEDIQQKLVNWADTTTHYYQ
jgi:hypothetical protein